VKSVIAVVLVLQLAAAPAWAGDITLAVTKNSDTQPTITAPEGGSTTVSSAQIADEELARLLAGERLANPSLATVDGQPVSDAVFIKGLAARFLTELKVEAERALGQQAAREAQRQIPAITFVPR
jgi:hypothetical protein